MTVIAGSDPTAALIEPTSSSTDYMWTIRIECGVVAGGIDALITSLTGFSPLQEWVFSPLAGDWVALDKGASAWANAGNAAQAIKDNVNGVPKQMGDGWRGPAADEFAASQTKIVDALADLPEACHQMSEMASAISEAAKAVADVIALVIDELVQFGIEMVASLAVPVAGEVAMPVWITKLVVKVAAWSTKISKAIAAFGRLVVKLITLARKLAGVVIKVAGFLSKLYGGKAPDVLEAMAKVLPIAGLASSKIAAADRAVHRPLPLAPSSGGGR